MKFDLLAAVLATLAVAEGATTGGGRFRSRHVVHESRAVANSHTWKKAARLHHKTILPVRIGLTQRNLHRAEEFIHDVSHPDSPNYGRHWTQEEVADMFAPPQEAIDAVTAWVASETGLLRDAIALSRGRNWVQFNASVSQLESLLKTEYHVYQHANHGGHHVACDQYHVPEHLQEHIDIVMPTVHFDGRQGAGRTTKTEALADEHQTELKRRAISQRWTDATGGAAAARPRFHARGKQSSSVAAAPTSSPAPKDNSAPSTRPQRGIMGAPTDASLTKQGAVIKNALMDLSQCDTMITPACLQALYNTPAGTLAASNNSLGIVEYTPQAILQSDLDLYFSQFQPKLQGTSPIIKLLDNAVVQTTNQSFSFNGESALDLEFAMALIFPQRATLFQVGDLVQGGSFNNLLDSLDGSYCAFEGGGSTNANIDGQYSAEVNCGTAAPTNVISTSYSYNEGDLTAAYEQRQCNEYMKLGLQGVTVIYSSGDFGVAGNGDACIDATTGAYNNGTSGLFNPSFPGTCPYVTSVGATELVNGTSVRGAESACQKVIFSGGGFSNVFGMPSYQQKAVQSYMTNAAPPYGANRFNNSGNVRGYPDVSANGANYVTAVNGNFTLSFGTSASAPVFAAIINLINEKRIEAGKGPVGFVNPALYANPSVLNDITSGNNPGCGTNGFTAVPGWDPLTGLGTPNYPAMEKMFLSLQ
ncbi:protease s8 tripeptidyl peptidase [Sporothrix brasiliensis 5110]|uniref:tripeptidyl-peptidase II n=1 Tax=Sporothrix brasiliensis 5110 TaxID=1398154 RepID=A0A0C2IJB8_9PEZI|nr:protease s8 tripeptidyl peptidase [Sporothrix brasiliensis 5110]KIH89246.1 protease s8 tripeptidyl peptidase [Sporothrix brasiliensis 5110]